MAEIHSNTDESGCQQCGLCCKVFGDRITPTILNLYTWMENQRVDILKFFWVWKEDGKVMSAADIGPKELADVLSTELRDPATGEYLSSCPFLHRVGKNRYRCAIHTMKPDMCCNYMPWIFGETYFPRCPSLRQRNKHLSHIMAETDPEE